MLFSWFELLVLIGITQGLVTSALLLRATESRKQKTLLALVLIGFCLISTKMVIATLGLANTSPAFLYMPIAVELGLPPLFYLYLVTLLTPTFQLTRQNLLHFIPFALFFTYALFIYFKVQLLGSSHETNKEIDAFLQLYLFSTVKKIEDYLTVVSIFFYISLSYFTFYQYQKNVKDTISDTDHPMYNWIQTIFIMSGLLLVFLVTNMMLDRVFKLDSYTILHWKLYFIYLASIIYYLGFKGYKISGQTPETGVFIAKPESIQANQTDTQKEKPKATPKLSSQKVEELARLFQQTLIDDKLYLCPTLNTQELATRLSVSQSNLSFAINQFFGKNYRDFVNDLRIKEVKTKLVDAAYRDVSILAISLECGFNSEASFYRIFKKSTGMSPKEFVNNQTSQ